MAQLKLKGYILMESMFAMIVIMTSFCISISIFNSMSDSQRNYLVVRAEIALTAEATKCKTEGTFFDTDISADGFVIERRIRPSERNKHVAILNLRAVTPAGKIISEYYEFVFNK